MNVKGHHLMWHLSFIVSCLCLQTGAKDIRSRRSGDPVVGRSPDHLPSPIMAGNSIIITNSISNDTTNTTNTTNNGTNMHEPIAKGLNTIKSMADAARMPGTNWCGKGWRADGFYKFGAYAGADRCCRQHDLGCHESIEPGQTKYGLTNVRFHAVMHCACDERFRSCLGMAKTKASDMVGNLFFNVIQIPCFVFTRQKICKNKTWWGKCLEKVQEKRAVWRKSIMYTRI